MESETPAVREIAPAPACGYAALAARWERRIAGLKARIGKRTQSFGPYADGMAECLDELRAEIVKRLSQADFFLGGGGGSSPKPSAADKEPNDRTQPRENEHGNTTDK